MTEKEKMLSGMLYDADHDPELIEERRQCKMLCQQYNETPVEDSQLRKDRIKQILGKTGEEINMEPNFWCDYGYNIEVGENFYSNHNLVILDPAKVTFGDNVLLGPNCGFYTAEHPIDPERRKEALESARPITVGNDVWIGGGVQVMPGVTIGDGTVIGSGSVVTKEIPDHVVAAGNPCRVIRRVTVEKLEDKSLYTPAAEVYDVGRGFRLDVTDNGEAMEFWLYHSSDVHKLLLKQGLPAQKSVLLAQIEAGLPEHFRRYCEMFLDGEMPQEEGTVSEEQTAVWGEDDYDEDIEFL